MAIVWTKDWSGADDGTVLGGIDLKNIQDDLSDVTDISAIGVTVQAFDEDLDTLSSPENVNSANLLFNGAFDTFTVTPTPDNWVVEGGGTEAQDTTNVRVGENSYSVTSDADGSASRQTVYATIDGITNSYWRGKTVTLTAQVYATDATNARIQIDDGIATSESLYHTGTPGYEELTVTRTISGSATKLDVVLLIDGNAQEAKFDAVRLNHGEAKWQFVRHNEDVTQAGAAAPTTPSQEEFDSSGTFTAPTGITRVMVTLCGGGGGGGAGSFSSGGGAGGSGGGSIINFPVVVVPGDDYTVTVGTGGSAGVTPAGSGGSGGDTIFDVGGEDVTAPGGTGGEGGQGVVRPAVGGASVNESPDATASGAKAEEIPGPYQIIGSGKGGDGWNSGVPPIVGAGGGTSFGVGGPPEADATEGIGGGGGGSGAFNPTGVNGHAGRDGICIVSY